MLRIIFTVCFANFLLFSSSCFEIDFERIQSISFAAKCEPVNASENESMRELYYSVHSCRVNYSSVDKALDAIEGIDPLKSESIKQVIYAFSDLTRILHKKRPLVLQEETVVVCNADDPVFSAISSVVDMASAIFDFKEQGGVRGFLSSITTSSRGNVLTAISIDDVSLDIKSLRSGMEKTATITDPVIKNAMKNFICTLIKWQSSNFLSELISTNRIQILLKPPLCVPKIKSSEGSFDMVESETEK